MERRKRCRCQCRAHARGGVGLCLLIKCEEGGHRAGRSRCRLSALARAGRQSREDVKERGAKDMDTVGRERNMIGGWGDKKECQDHNNPSRLAAACPHAVRVTCTLHAALRCAQRWTPNHTKTRHAGLTQKQDDESLWVKYISSVRERCATAPKGGRGEGGGDERGGREGGEGVASCLAGPPGTNDGFVRCPNGCSGVILEGSSCFVGCRTRARPPRPHYMWVGRGRPH